MSATHESKRKSLWDLAAVAGWIAVAIQLPASYRALTEPSRAILVASADYQGMDLPSTEVLGLDDLEIPQDVRHRYQSISGKIRLAITNSGDTPAKDVVIKLERSAFGTVKLDGKDEFKAFDGTLRLGDIRNSDTMEATFWVDYPLTQRDQVHITWIGGDTFVQPVPTSFSEKVFLSIPIVCVAMVALMTALKIWRLVIRTTNSEDADNTASEGREPSESVGESAESEREN